MPIALPRLSCGGRFCWSAFSIERVRFLIVGSVFSVTRGRWFHLVRWREMFAPAVRVDSVVAPEFLDRSYSGVEK